MMNLTDKIELAWNIRFSQKLSEFWQIFVAIKKDLGLNLEMLSTDRIDSLISKMPEHIPFILEVTALQASLARWQKQQEFSKKLLLHLQDITESLNITPTYGMQQEIAIMHFIEGQFATALEYFISAKSLATSNIKKFASLYNCLICVENLGLAQDGFLNELKELQKDTQISDPALSAEIFGSLYLYLSRCYFRKGEIALLQNQDNLKNFSKYYFQWVFSLPYVNFNQEIEKIKSENLEHVFNLYQGGYLFRTIVGIIHPDDHKIVKLSDAVDRLYLWTWYWLTDQKNITVAHLNSVINCLLNNSNQEYGYTAEDILQIRNAILWLSLFEPTFKNLQNRFNDQSIFSNIDFNNFELLEFERLIIEYFHLLKVGKQIEAQNLHFFLTTHRLYRNNNLHFTLLIDAIIQRKITVAPASLTSFCQYLLQLLTQNSDHHADIVSINPQTNMIYYNNQTIVSESLCLAIDILQKNNEISCKEFVSYVFKINKYDPFNHNTKIYNIFSRLKKIVPQDIQFKIKSNIILVHASKTWATILTINTKSQELSHEIKFDLFSQNKIEKVYVQNSKKILSSQEIIKRLEAFKGNGFTRRDAEAKWQSTRSTTNRILCNLIKKKIIYTEGAGRNTLYFLDKRG